MNKRQQIAQALRVVYSHADLGRLKQSKTYLGGAIFAGSTSFKNSCCKDCSEVILLDGSSINIRSSRSSATGGRLNKPNT